MVTLCDIGLVLDRTLLSVSAFERSVRMRQLYTVNGTEWPYYGRTLSDASMLYFADVFFIFYFFYGRLSWPNG